MYGQLGSNSHLIIHNFSGLFRGDYINQGIEPSMFLINSLVPSVLPSS